MQVCGGMFRSLDLMAHADRDDMVWDWGARPVAVMRDDVATIQSAWPLRTAPGGYCRQRGAIDPRVLHAGHAATAGPDPGHRTRGCTKCAAEQRGGERAPH